MIQKAKHLIIITKKSKYFKRSEIKFKNKEIMKNIFFSCFDFKNEGKILLKMKEPSNKNNFTK